MPFMIQLHQRLEREGIVPFPVRTIDRPDASVRSNESDPRAAEGRARG